MDLSFEYFWGQMVQNPLLFLAIVLTLGVIFDRYLCGYQMYACQGGNSDVRVF